MYSEQIRQDERKSYNYEQKELVTGKKNFKENADMDVKINLKILRNEQ